MAHLVCTLHKKRTTVLSDGTAVHRENSVKCDSGSVKIGRKTHHTNDVLYFATRPNMAKAMAHLRHGKIDAMR